MSILSSVGSRGVNALADVKRVQRLLNHQQGTAYRRGPIAVDGLVGPETIGAITDYQRSVVKLSSPDGRVDPGGPTIAALEQHARRRPGHAPGAPPTTPPPTGGLFTLSVRHGNVVPPSSGSGIYESTFTLAGPKGGTFHGSIYPDSLSEHGRILDGRYDLNLTFHKKPEGLKPLPTAADLRVKFEGLVRPALTFNGGGTVPVFSKKPGKVTAAGINVHNGQNNSRGSWGCLTIPPTEWSSFITIFLTLYPNLSDWCKDEWWSGRKIGTLEVKS